jgi:hypothetical protein
MSVSFGYTLYQPSLSSIHSKRLISMSLSVAREEVSLDVIPTDAKLVQGV